MGKQNPFSSGPPTTRNLIQLNDDDEDSLAQFDPYRPLNPTKTPKKPRIRKPKQCQLCGESFRDGRGLGSHVRNVHSPKNLTHEQIQKVKQKKKRGQGKKKPPVSDLIWLTL